MMNFKANKLIAMMLVILMVFSTTVTGFADELPEEEAQAKAAVEEIEEEKEPEKKPEEKPEPEPQPEPEPVKEEAPAQEPEQPQAQEEPQAEPAAEEKSQAEEPSEKETEKSVETKGQELKLNSGLSDGTYKPDSFTFEGGTGKAKVTCDKVIVKGGEATAAFKASSNNMTHFYMGTVSSDAEDTSIYDPSTDTCGSDVYKISKNIAYVPVTLNEKKPFAGRSVAMTEPHWIQYYYTLALSDDAEKISDDTTIPEEEETDPDPSGDKEDDKDKDDDKTPSKSKKLKDGTYKVKATTDRKMFYLYPKEKDPATVILVKKNGKMTATITLTGSGYDYVYMGTPAQAKKAGKSKWIKFKKKSGYYTFKIPVSKLDKKLPITPHSKKYESDGDPSTDPWRPDKWIKFYSKGAKKVKDGTSIKTKGKASNRNAASKSGSTKGKNDGKAASQSKYTDDSGKSTSAVNNSTGLKDGVYSPDRFSWSGGSGRLAYIRCNKITVKGGKAIATIEFSSSKYDSLKANGRVYSRSGGGNSTFNIPVKLNANNTIIGRTTAMSQPHWVKYTIFIYKKGAGAGKNGKASEEGDDGHLTSTKKLSSEAPDLMGLEFDEEVEVKYAKYFKIYKYEQGITLIEVDQTRDTALYKEEKKSKSGKKNDAEKKDDGSQGTVEYDDEGNIIAKSQNEIAEGLYQNNIVNYLIVPKDVEIPAGLDKDCIIIKQPADSTFMSSEAALEMMSDLGALDSVKLAGFDEKDIKNKDLKQAIKDEKAELAGTAEKPLYAKLVKAEANFAVLPSETLPEELDEEPTEDEKKESEEKTEALTVLQKRFSALAVPMLIDRSEHEKNNYASEEWLKVYGAIYGKAEEAEKAFDEFVKNNDKKKNQ